MKAKLLLASAVIAPLLMVAAIVSAQASALSGQLSVGASGPDVTSLQTFLATNSSFYPSGLVTGYYGPLTQAAVERFQTSNGLEAVGNVGPLTLALINQQIAAGGNATGNGGTGAVVSSGAVVLSPTLSPETVSTTANSATFTWTSDQPAIATVMYGTTLPFVYSTSPSVVGTAGYSSSQSVTITGLNPHTTYYYALKSTDAQGNYSLTIEKPFTTPNN